MTLRPNPLESKDAHSLLLQAGFPLLYLSGQWNEVMDRDKYKAWLYKVFIMNSANQGIYLWGDVGAGKSSIAGLMALFLKRYFYGEILFTGCSEMIAEIYSRKDSPSNRYKECQVLVLDDLGKEYHHEYGVSRLHEVIEYRYSRLLTTIVTSNLSQLDLIEKAKRTNTEGLWKSMADRLRDEKWMKTRKVSGMSKRVCL